MIRENVAEMVTNLNAQHKARIKRLVQRGIMEEWDHDELTRQVRTVVGLTERAGSAVEAMRTGLISQGVPKGVARSRAKAYADTLRTQRAGTIADFEVRSAIGEAQRRSWARRRALGLIPPYAVRRWKTHRDERTCPICKPMNGQRAALDRPYFNGVLAPPAHPNCRCTEELVHGQEVLNVITPKPAELIDTSWIAKAHSESVLARARSILDRRAS